MRFRLKACGICQSDVHSMEGAWGRTLPSVFGHESAGIVDEVGDGVEGLQSGQHFVVTLIRACHKCFLCQIGQPAL